MKKFLFVCAVNFIFVVILTACGGSDSTKPSTSLNVEMSEFKFTPTSMTVYANKETNLNLKNNGAVEHEFTILKKGSAASIPFDSEKQAADILFHFKLGANQTESYKFILPEAGEYSIICAIQGHMESGMVAKLIAVNP